MSEEKKPLDATKSGVAGAWGGLQSLVAEVDRIKDKLDKVAGELGVEARPPKQKRRVA